MKVCDEWSSARTATQQRRSLFFFVRHKLAMGWVEVKSTQPPVLCIHFNQPNKNNSTSFSLPCIFFARLLSIIIVIVGDIQSSKSLVCIFSPFVFIVFSFVPAQIFSTYLSFSIHTVLILTIICARIIRFDVVLCRYIVKCECNVPTECEKKRTRTTKPTLQCIQKHKHTAMCMQVSMDKYFVFQFDCD